MTSRRELREARAAEERARRKGVVGRIGSSSAKAGRAAGSAGGSLASRTGVRERRRQREREQTRGLRRLAVGLAVLAAVLLGAWFLVNQLGGDDEAPAAVVRTQRVVLLQVTGPDGPAVANALLAYDEKSGGDGLILMPAGLTIAGEGANPLSLGDAAQEDGGRPARDQLGKLLGVRIDGSLVLDQAAFAALIEQSNEGVITVDVPEEVTAGGVTIKRGEQKLDGSSAAAYAAHLGRGESEADRLGRLEAVLEGLVPAFPQTPGAAAALPAALGAGAELSLPDTELGAVLAGLAKTADLRYERMPTTAPETAAGGEPAYTLDRAKADQLVASLLNASRTSG